jgi:hypothetical protein
MQAVCAYPYDPKRMEYTVKSFWPLGVDNPLLGQGLLDALQEFLPPTITTNRERLFGNELAPLLILKEMEVRLKESELLNIREELHRQYAANEADQSD